VKKTIVEALEQIVEKPEDAVKSYLALPDYFFPKSETNFKANRLISKVDDASILFDIGIALFTDFNNYIPTEAGLEFISSSYLRKLSSFRKSHNL
jgi:hypothetical protein